MDQRQFDRLARLLGGATDRRAGLKAAFGALLGAGGAAAALELDAEAKKQGKDNDRKGAAGPDAEKRKKRKKTCKPACTGGYVCRKIDGAHQCVCETGLTCGAACCAAGQVCEGGTCVADPQPTTCIAFGEPCKGVGRRCCDGLSCASGQDGSFPIACYKSKGAACTNSAECTYGMACTNGSCLAIPVPTVPTGAACSGGANCAQSGATCTAYTTSGAPGGEYCTLPLLKQCTGHPDCTCYNCWYVNDGATIGGRQDRVSGPVMACVQPKGGGCETNVDCARGLTCDQTTKTCTGTAQCIPPGAPCGSGDCCAGSTCQNGTCTSGPSKKQLGERCDPSADICVGANGQTNYYIECQKYGNGVGTAATDLDNTYCLGKAFYQTTDPSHCSSYLIYSGSCTENCNVYLNAGATTADPNSTDALRGASLKTALEAFQPTAENPTFYIEPDADGAIDRKYVTDQITLAVSGEMYIRNCVTASGGPKPVLSGNDTNRIMSITVTGSSPFGIDSVDFENGKATAAGTDTGDGGAIRIDSTGWTGTLTSSSLSMGIYKSTVKTSKAAGNGGGIYSIGTFSVWDTNITGCSATGSGGGWYANTAGTQVAVLQGSSDINTNSAATEGAGLFWTGTAYNATAFNFSDGPLGLFCPQNQTQKVQNNTDATATPPKYDCAYGNVKPNYNNTGNWPFTCRCTAKEPF